jgi:hypothetical protein
MKREMALCGKFMRLGTKLGILIGSVVIGSGGVAYWMTTASYALFDMAYVSKDVKSRFDVDALSKNLTDVAIEEVSRQAVSDLQNEKNGFAQFGKMLGMGMLQQMRPAIEVKIKDEISKSITTSDSSVMPNLKGVRYQGDEVFVALERSGKEFELVMEKTKGIWKFTKLSDRSTKEFLSEMRKNAGAVSTTSPQITPTAIDPAPVSIPEPESPQVNSSRFNAEIFDPPSNCRIGPGSDSDVKQVFQKGDVLVDRNNPATDRKGEAWYRESDLGCWLHHSQIRFK